MKTKWTCLVGVVLITVMGCAVAWGQATAQISGIVKDTSGAVLPGAEITVTQTETGLARKTISNETGSYVLPDLPLGPYRMEVSLPGFKTFVQTGVLQVNSSPVVTAVLEVGQVAETVEVQANAAAVETRSVGIAQLMENERILELPLDGRNVTELITLTGTAVSNGAPVSKNFAAATSESAFISINGGLGYGVAYNLDGAPHGDQYSGLAQPFPFPDALQEFKVETSGVTAQNGGQSGGYVNSVTKSGTNAMHGDLFEFVRNDLFNARPYFSTTGSTLKRNQFGGTAGGPVVKNKLFFFGAFEGTTIRSDPADVRTFVPTAAMLAGDFTFITSPACNAAGQVNLKAPFVNNKINPSLFSPAALKLAALLPTPVDGCGNTTYGNINSENDYQVVGRVDYQLSNKHTVFGRYLDSWYNIGVPYALDHNLLSTGTAGYHSSSQALTLGSTYLVSSNVVNSFRLAAGLTGVYRQGPQIPSAPDLGINAYSYLPHFITVTVTSGPSVGGTLAPDSSFTNYNVQANDDVSIQRGSHQIVFGGVLSRADANSKSNVGVAGLYSFNGQQTGLGMADFLTGKLSSFAQNAAQLNLVHRYYIGLYVQDTWKMKPRLTVNYGLRWEPYLPEVDDDGRNYSFDQNRFNQGIKSTVFPNAPAGLYFPGDPGFPGNSGVNKDFKLVQPRLGLAWDVRGDGRTAVRASYGLNYTFLPMVWSFNGAKSPPWGSSLTFPSPAGGFDNPFLGVTGGNPFPLTFDKNSTFVQNGQYNTEPFNMKNTYAESWNLSLQKQIKTNWIVSAAYTGSLTLHLWTQQELNTPVFMGLGPCQINGVSYTVCSTTANEPQRRKLALQNPQQGPYYSLLSQYEGGGTQNYHAMLINIERRAGKGVTVKANYTWSHCIGDFTDTNGDGPNPGTDDWQNDNNRRGDRGNCPTDRRQNLNLTSVATTPAFANRTLRTLASAWSLSAIWRLSSGSPLNVTSGVDNSLTSKPAQRAQQIMANPYGNSSGRPGSSYLNPNAFQAPATGTFGNAGMNSVYGPESWTFNTALLRGFRFHESQRIEFRAEAFNVLNKFEALAPGAAINSSTFGVIRTAGTPRVLQFALKWIF